MSTFEVQTVPQNIHFLATNTFSFCGHKLKLVIKLVSITKTQSYVVFHRFWIDLESCTSQPLLLKTSHVVART